MNPPTPEKARWDAQELEYKRIDDTLRARTNFTLTRNIYAIMKDPTALFGIAELDRDVWDNLRPAFQNDPRRKTVDDGMEFLANEANRLFTLLIAKKKVNAEDVFKFFKKERDMFGLMNDMRQEKGMGIGTRKEWTSEDEKKAFKYYTRGGKSNENETVGNP